MKSKLRRLWCCLFGCRTDEHGWCCIRCGAALYDDFISNGRLRRFQDIWWTVKWGTIYFFRGAFGPVPGCEVCGKKMRRWKDRKERCCSDECYSELVPF